MSDGQLVAECFGSPALDTERPLWDMFSQTASRYPDHEAVVSKWQNPSMTAPWLSENRDASQTDVRWSYADLLRVSTRLADCFRSRGFRRGMHLVVFLWNSAEWALSFWAAAKLGLVFIPVDPRSADGDIVHCLRATQPAVLVAQDSDLARRLQGLASEADGLSSFQSCLRLCCCSAESSDGWENLQSVLETPVDIASAEPIPDEPAFPGTGEQESKHAVIVFTSGTTGTPKGCPHSSANLWSQVADFDPDPEHCKDRWCVHTPLSHIFGINNSARAWRFGGTVVFPSKAFEVKATLRALVEEKCTFMSAVPALVKALITDDDFPGLGSLSLRYVTLGSTGISEDDIRLCQKTLLTNMDAIQCFGMSEGAPLTSWNRADPLLDDGYSPGCGKALPGCNLRICKPGTREVLLRNEKGELHIGGTNIISGYLSDVSQEDFYRDHFGNWFVTGDQASIDEHGVLHIVGRYKDIIIRGGHNIAPMVIEKAVNEIEGVSSQVVGVPDPVAGQVPVAVIKAPEGVSKRAVAEKATSLGTQFALAAVYTLEELGLASFPSTVSGKIRKGELKTTVILYRRRLQTPPLESHDMAPARSDAVKKELQHIWQDLIGILPSYSQLIPTFADSITILRYCDRVTTTLGKRLYLQDFIGHPTIDSQAVLLEERVATYDQWETGDEGFLLKPPHRGLPSPPNSSVKRLFPVVDGMASNKLKSPKAGLDANMTLATAGSDQQTSQTHSAAAATVEASGLDVADVQDIIPIKDFYHRLALGPRPQSYRNRFATHMGGTSMADVRRGLEAALSSRHMFRTLLCQTTGGLFHVVVKPSDTLFSRLIETSTVADDHGRDECIHRGSSDSFSTVFMFQAKVILVESTQELYLSTTMNHSVFDALSLIAWHQDLDRLIANPGYVVPRLTPFKMFADLTHLYQKSIPAQTSVDFNVRRLRGLSRFPDALWPPQRAPGWFQAEDDDTLHAAQRDAIRAELWDSWETKKADFRHPRTTRIVAIPWMDDLRTKEHIEPSLLAKAAIALFNVYQTGQPFAIYNHLDAARSWPFVPAWMERGLPPPMSIDGPTFEFVLNMTNINLRSRETVQQLLVRMRDENEELSKHSHAPWLRVLHGLGNEADVAVDASYRQTFVWDVSIRMMGQSTNDYQVLKVIGRYDWADCGIFWNCCMLDKTNMMIVASWDTAQLTDVEVDDHCDTLADIMRKLASEGNFNRSLREVFGGGLGRAAYNQGE